MLKKIAVTLFVMLAASVNAQVVPWGAKLPFDKAVVNYTISGTEKGTQTLYIKDGGQNVAKHRKTSMKMMGIKQETETIEITSPEHIISINLKEKSGTKQINPVKIMLEEYNKLSAADKKKVIENASKTGNNIMAGMQGKVSPKATKIHGFDCDKVEVMGVKSFQISGTNIELKSESNIMGMKSRIEATGIDTKAAIPANAFQIPANIKLKTIAQADAMTAQMAKNTIAGLVGGSAKVENKNGKGKPANTPPAGMPEGLADLQKMMQQMNFDQGQDEDE